MSKYAKALVAVGALAVAVGRAVTDGSIDPTEWATIGTALTAAVGVWYVPNKPAV
jgi:hypothetical protein